MAGSADFIQRMVHALEQGAYAVWIKRGLVVVGIIGLALFYFMHEFAGLATSQAMDQAQIGREIASGHGFKTQLMRPRAMGQLQEHGRNVTQSIGSDTYNAPLPPIVNAIALLPVHAYWKMSPRDLTYVGDRAIAFLSILFFLGSIVVLYFVALRLFDQRLALLGCGLVLVCDSLWQYSLSGLPQMLLLLLFNATIYFLVRAVEAQSAGADTARWLGAVGIGFGLLALTHALTIWMFVAALIFCAFFFRPRIRGTIILLAAFAIIYAPWLIRNQIVCGNPGGVAIYAALDGIRHSEAGHMRHVSLDLEGVSPGYFRNKLTANIVTQLGKLYQYLGWSVVAPVFFLSLLHSFRRRETSVMRWIILTMWGGAVVGMALYGLSEEQGVAANQLHIIFVPIMGCFGLAYLLVQWNRLGITLRLARIGFLALLFLLCALPMLLILVLPSKPLIRWPPYVPPYIAVLNDWMKPNELVASDMPWAIAWYADRRSVWLPETVAKFGEMSDYGIFGGPINGLYLTPVSGGQNTMNDIFKGEYKDWATVILRSVDFKTFPLKWATVALGVSTDCVFFSDHDREHQAVK